MDIADERTLEQISRSVVKGDQASTVAYVQDALDAEIEVNTILQVGLINAMSEVGRLFEDGEYFVPEMLIAARAMKSGLELIKPFMTSADIKPSGKVALGTVQGDLHDIGKNLVGIMLEGSGFTIYDLGTDVSPEQVVEVIKTEQVDLIGLSALLTTTMPMMETTIQAIIKADLRDRVKIMIGGAPVTQDYADRIGADGFAPDASQATRLAINLMGQ
ncbi:MAG: cobalamin B12-binding domain-containing protein [Anaerolineales bacterium]